MRRSAPASKLRAINESLCGRYCSLVVVQAACFVLAWSVARFFVAPSIQHSSTMICLCMCFGRKRSRVVCWLMTNERSARLLLLTSYLTFSRSAKLIFGCPVRASQICFFFGLRRFAEVRDALMYQFWFCFVEANGVLTRSCGVRLFVFACSTPSINLPEWAVS